MLITHIDKHYKMTRWTLADVLAFALAPPAHADADERKFNQRLVDKLKYCKEVLVSIRTASAAGGNAVPEESDAMGAAFAGAGTSNMGSIASKASKMSLR